MLFPIKNLGKADCFGTNDIKLSQCRKILVSSGLSLYLTVDNNMHLFSYNCEMMKKRVLIRIYMIVNGFNYTLKHILQNHMKSRYLKNMMRKKIKQQNNKK